MASFQVGSLRQLRPQCRKAADPVPSYRTCRHPQGDAPHTDSDEDAGVVANINLCWSQRSGFERFLHQPSVT